MFSNRKFALGSARSTKHICQIYIWTSCTLVGWYIVAATVRGITLVFLSGVARYLISKKVLNELILVQLIFPSKNGFLLDKSLKFL